MVAHGDVGAEVGMPGTGVSSTAVMAAVTRGWHRLEDAWPWVFDDPYALGLVGPGWPERYARMRDTFREPVLRRATGAMVGRSRYTEDRLLGGDFGQYVILGAGLDSFAWRRPDVLPRLRVVEIDQPATQAYKRERAGVLALPEHERHVFVPVDFETATLRDGLDGAGLDRSVPALFSWLGVTQYLTAAAIAATLRTVASYAPGSEIVISYVPPHPYLDDLGREFLDTLSRVAGERGEPVRTVLSATEAEDLVRDCGLRVGEHPTRDEIHARYFAGRGDGLTVPTTQRLLTAVVPG